MRLEKKITTTYTMVHDDGTEVSALDQSKIERIMEIIDKGWLRSNSSTAALSNNSRLGITTELLTHFEIEEKVRDEEGRLLSRNAFGEIIQPKTYEDGTTLSVVHDEHCLCTSCMTEPSKKELLKEVKDSVEPNTVIDDIYKKSPGV